MRRRRKTGEPIACMRRTFSRMPVSERPNGEWTSRRAPTSTGTARQAIEIGGLAEQVEAEAAEDRPDLHALQPVVAAGELGRLVGGLVQHRRDDQVSINRVRPVVRRMTRPDRQPDQRRRRRRGEQPGDRLAPAMRREEPGGIGAGAEERGMAQGDDPGIAEDQIGREREQDRRQDLRAERQIVGKDEIGRERQQPGQGLERAEAVAPREGIDRSRRGLGASRPAEQAAAAATAAPPRSAHR